MKLTIDQVAKLTKLSVPTIRVYASRQKLGTKEGNKRVFSQADVQKLLKGSKRPTGKAGAKPKAKTSARARPAVKKQIKSRAQTVPPKPVKARVEEPAAKPVKKSFWSFFQRKPKQKQKISLLSAKTTK